MGNDFNTLVFCHSLILSASAKCPKGEETVACRLGVSHPVTSWIAPKTEWTGRESLSSRIDSITLRKGRQHTILLLCQLFWLQVNFVLNIDQEISPDESEVPQGKVLICTSDQGSLWFTFWAIWKSLLLVIGIFLAWETRNVNYPSLNDSRYIGMSVYNAVIMTLITASLSFVVGRGNMDTKYAL